MFAKAQALCEEVERIYATSEGPSTGALAD
jgi:hypothetical protein